VNHTGQSDSAPQQSSGFLKWIAGGFLLLGIFVAVITTTSMLNSRALYQERATITAQNLAQVIEQTISSSITRIDLTVQATAHEAERQLASGRINERSANAFIDWQFAMAPELDSLRIVDSAGNIAYGIGVKPGPKATVVDREYFQRAREDKTIGLQISKPVIGKISKKNVLIFARRINLPNGNFGGVAFAAVSLEHFQKLFTALNFGQHGVVALRESDAGLLARFPTVSGPSGEVGSKLVSADFLKILESKSEAGTYSSTSPADKIERAFAYRRIPNYGAYVVVGIGVDDYLAQWQAELRKTLALAGLFLLVILLAVWVILRAWRRQTEALTRLASAEREVRLLNTDLEQRVDIRTHELAAANDQLKEALSVLENAKDELVQSEKLSSLGALVAGVAHELNTPIGNALLVASAMEDEFREFKESLANGLTRTALNQYVDKASEGTQILLSNLHRSAGLIAGFKQIAADQTSEQRRMFMLDETIDEVVQVMSPALRRTPHLLEAEVPTGIQLDSYPGPISRIIINLINNALLHAFTDKKSGQIRISARELSEYTVEIRFSDNGAGMEPETLHRVFDPFFTTKLGKGGSGLGMHIAYTTATQLLGGKIDVSSTPGAGTLWRITLPKKAPLLTA
jgi:signal transduction histidine kinase